MSQEAVAPRVRLNADVWQHTAAILGDAKALCALEAVSRELLTAVRKHDAAWRVALGAGANPVLAAAFVEAAPGARNLCRGWLQRWRAQPLDPESARDPTLCVPWGGDYSGPFTESAPRVVFEISDNGHLISERDHHAGVMVWDGLLATGEKDDDRSLVFMPEHTICYYPATWIETHGAGDDPGLTTSCYVVDESTGAMIELWRGVNQFEAFDPVLGKWATQQHGILELMCFPPNESAAHVLDQARVPLMDTIPPDGVDLMTLYGYVRFEEHSPAFDESHPVTYEMLDMTVTIGIQSKDTKHEFDDLARMLTSALACHKEARGQGVFAT